MWRTIPHPIRIECPSVRTRTAIRTWHTTSSCSRALWGATTFLPIPFRTRVVARPCTGSRRRPSAPCEADANSARTRPGAVRSSNRLLKIFTRCAMNRCKSLTPWRKGGGAARQWSGEEWHGNLRCALGLHSSWTWSRPLKRLHSRSARPWLHPWLTIRYVCAVCDRRRLLLLLWSQDRRASTARRCGSLLYIGLHHAQQFVALGAAAREFGAWIPLGCCGTRGGYGGYIVLCGLLRPSDHELFASGGDRALRTDVLSLWGA